MLAIIILPLALKLFTQNRNDHLTRVLQRDSCIQWETTLDNLKVSSNYKLLICSSIERVGSSSKGSSSREIHNPRIRYCEHDSNQVCRPRTDTFRSNGRSSYESAGVNIPSIALVCAVTVSPSSHTRLWDPGGTADGC